jgi:uncharacterized membrane protein
VAFWGGFWGLLFGAGLFLIPGLGPILVAGPLVAGLVSIGIPRNSVLKYEVALKTDKYLLVVHGTEDAVNNANSGC